ncbi:hypothetical protein RHGRI_021645 [Rhododendron griersonianum]|uniref:Beta-catenin-like protein 1 N-terminal domain-containing protein n=1 Tax=Rhododendron griersonianum TaxID=479676 RepID=A0AAV6JP87_9ERIC|nr:hypothetical protein RHGRI_021645 [Rhododendron griersonianum]
MELPADARSHAPKRKRPAAANDDDDFLPPPPPPTARYDNGVDLSLLEALEKSQASTAIDLLDLKTLKKLVLSFERRLKDNIEARLKYPSQPEKFADSEIDLHEEIQKLKILAGGPELYPDLVNLNTIPSLLGLLTHDNTDISNDVVSLIQDLTDEDVLEDNDEPALVLVDALVENNVLELLVQNLLRLNETDPDEVAAVYGTLATIENLIEVKPAVAELVCEKTKLMRWLLGKIKVREFDGSKQYASEILAILLGQINGVDVVLQAVAMYKSRDPKTPDEEEMVENLFDCLCCLLMPLENKERFVNAEGVELMIIVMNQKKSCYGSAIRALDFAMTNYPPACERFVDVMGLKTAFPAFMVLSLDSHEQEYEETLQRGVGRAPCITNCIIICIHFDFLLLSETLETLGYEERLMCGILRGSRKERLMSKFVENECEKIDRLMELYMRYSNRVKAETEWMDKLELDELEMDEEEKYNRRLESGLYTLQLIAVILGHLWTSEHPKMRTRIELLLKQNKLTKKDVKNILQEYHDNIGDLDGPEEKERAQTRIQKFISAF